jgi:hypothetical protein
MWQELYRVENSAWNRINPKTQTQDDLAEDDDGKFFTLVVYCRECGLQIPLSVATVDHQAAQNGGETKAMFRFFRAIGCTEASGAGRKSQRLLAYFNNNGMQVTDSTPQSGNKLDRYTLNDFGVLYYSILRAAGLMAEFKNACMHGGFNLRPVCPPCNSRLRNTGADIGLG